MRALVIFDTVSESKMTGKIAEIVTAALRESGVPVESYFVADAGKVRIEDFDCLVIGAPTMGWRPSQRMKEFLAGLEGKAFAGKMAATFDTQLESGFSGNATKHMEKSLTALGFRIVSPALIAYVQNDKKLYKLKEGQSEKAMTWSQELAEKLLK